MPTSNTNNAAPAKALKPPSPPRRMRTAVILPLVGAIVVVAGGLAAWKVFSDRAARARYEQRYGTPYASLGAISINRLPGSIYSPAVREGCGMSGAYEQSGRRLPFGSTNNDYEVIVELRDQSMEINVRSVTGKLPHAQGTATSDTGPMAFVAGPIRLDFDGNYGEDTESVGSTFPRNDAFLDQLASAGAFRFEPAPGRSLNVPVPHAAEAVRQLLACMNSRGG